MQAGEDVKKALEEAHKRIANLEAQVGKGTGKESEEGLTEKQDNDAKIKALDRKKRNLLSLDEEQVEAVYGSKDAWNAQIQKLSKEKDELLAANRGLQPIKTQH